MLTVDNDNTGSVVNFKQLSSAFVKVKLFFLLFQLK